MGTSAIHEASRDAMTEAKMWLWTTSGRTRRRSLTIEMMERSRATYDGA